MSKYILKAVKLFAGGFNLSGDVKTIALNLKSDILDTTTFASVGKEKLPGMKDFSLSYSGYVDTGQIGQSDEEFLFNSVNLGALPFTVAPVTGAENEICYFGQTINMDYKFGGNYGEMFGFDMSSEGNNLAINGTLLKSGTVTTTGNTNGVNIGQVASDKKLYANLHVLSASGTNPSITVKVQSAATQGGSYTDRITFTAATEKGAQFATPVSGAITDQYWRVQYTITGTTPSFVIAVAVGMQ